MPNLETKRKDQYARTDQGKAPSAQAVPRVDLDIGPKDLANIRFAFSQTWECLMAFRACVEPSKHSLLQPWSSQFSQKLRSANWEPLRSLAVIPRGIIPDFLTQPSVTPEPRFSDEIMKLVQTPSEIVRNEMEAAFPSGIPKELRKAIDNPLAFLSETAEVITEFWQCTLRPIWGTIRQTLDGEVVYRAHALAFGGPEELFRGMHRDISYQNGHLTIFIGYGLNGQKREPGLMLVPSVFSWPEVYLTLQPPWPNMLNYSARGIADIWDDNRLTGCNGLIKLFGKSRTQVLVHLRTPQTTLGIATHLRLSSATVSEHIRKLYGARILERTRLGKSVFYSLNATGKDLLAAFTSRY